MNGLTSPLWPIRYRPLPDELLSSWLVRLAHGHGLKVQTLCNLIFGDQRQVWNRDIDRLAPMWLITELCRQTDTPFDVAWATTLRTYEGWLYPKYRSSGMLHWILMLNMYHRKRQGYGMQFCPHCLASDPVPYLRKSWRVAFNTVCAQHGNLLADRCPACGASQGGCRLIHATNCVLSRARRWSPTTASRSGLSVTATIGDQSRVRPDQRAGLRSRARRYV